MWLHGTEVQPQWKVGGPGGQCLGSAQCPGLPSSSTWHVSSGLKGDFFPSSLSGPFWKRSRTSVKGKSHMTADFGPFYFRSSYFSIRECPSGSSSDFLILCKVSHFLIFLGNTSFMTSAEMPQMSPVSGPSWGQSPVTVCSLEQELAIRPPALHWNWVQNLLVPHPLFPFGSLKSSQ